MRSICRNRKRVLFIDASVSCAAPYAFSRLHARKDTNYSSHVMSPMAVLHAYRELYGNPPAAYLLEVRGERFELGESLSSAAALNLEASLGLLKKLYSSTNPPEWEPFIIMSKHYLNPLFTPSSLPYSAPVTEPDRWGRYVFQNMLESGFQGALYPINPKYPEVQGKRAYASIAEISEPVELVVIATPPQTVLGIIESCGIRGVKAAIIITAGFGETGYGGAELERELLETARRYGIRLVGPNCLGIMRPAIGLNATFNRGGANSGNIAFVSQSGALCTAILDWAQSNEVGFSSIVSMGSSTDVDFGEILDYLVSDASTHSILMYIEGIRNARSFMSALRAATRIKPVILVKVGRHAAAARAALSHTASLVGADDVFNAAVSRAGAVRVQTITQLFTAAKALSCGFCPVGSRLAIVTNGGGPGVMATIVPLTWGSPWQRSPMPRLHILISICRRTGRMAIR